MRLRIFKAFMMASLLVFGALPLHAIFTVKKGKIIDVELIANYSAQEHFTMGSDAFHAGDWTEAVKQFRIVILNFPSSPYAQEGYFYSGICYSHLNEYDFSNEAFTDYLKGQSNPRFFQETIEYKYAIADRLSEGAKRRFFGTKKLPKWACGKALALEIYDEVIAAVPSHEIAARALVSKGCLLWKLRDYRPCIEAFQLAIRRFPKHELTPECYLYISRVFIEQSRIEFQNPDILAFAEINLNRFRLEFPREERIAEVEQNVQMIKEIYARGLYDTGRFYERTHKPGAAILYYRNAISRFPETCIAGFCRTRLVCLDPEYAEAAFDCAPQEDMLERSPSGQDFIFDMDN